MLLQSDRDLAVASAAGECDAFAELVRRYFGRVYDFAYRLLRSPAETAQLIREVFLGLAAAPGTLAVLPHPRGVVYGAAYRNAIVRLQRSNSVDAGTFRADAESDLLCRLEAARGPLPTEALGDRELAALVWQGVASLDRRQYALLDLVVRQELTPSELAATVGVDAAGAEAMAERVRAAAERAVGALLLVRRGRRWCRELDSILTHEETNEVGVHLRRQVESHAADCPRCQQSRERMGSPLRLFGCFAPVPPTPGLRSNLMAAALELLPAGSRAGSPARGDREEHGSPRARVGPFAGGWFTEQETPAREDPWRPAVGTPEGRAGAGQGRRSLPSPEVVPPGNRRSGAAVAVRTGAEEVAASLPGDFPFRVVPVLAPAPTVPGRRGRARVAVLALGLLVVTGLLLAALLYEHRGQAGSAEGTALAEALPGTPEAAPEQAAEQAAATAAATPALLVEPSTEVDFGPESSERLLTFRNAGETELAWEARAEVPWLQLTPSVGTLAPGESGAVRVVLDRTLLGEGAHEETVAILVGEQEVAVIVRAVAPGTGPAIADVATNAQLLEGGGGPFVYRAGCEPEQTAFTVSASVSDPSGLATVELVYVPPDGQEQRREMTLRGDRYEAALGPFSFLAPVEFYVAATDSVGNVSSGEAVAVEILDCGEPTP